VPPLTGIWTRLTGGVTALGVGAASRDAIEPVLEVTKQQAWARRALRILPINTAAQAAAQGIDRNVDYADDAKRQGIGRNRWLVYRDLAQTFPGVGEVLAAFRRDASLADEAHDALRRQGYTEAWTQRLLGLRYSTMDAGTLAQLVSHGWLPEATGATLANRSGVTDDNFGRLVDAARTSPQTGQILDWANRTGKTDAETAAALGASGLREDWRGRIASLREYLTPPSDLIRMAVREVFSPGLREELTLDENFPEPVMEHASKLGIDRQTMLDYWAAHWELPSATQGAQMMFRAGLKPAEYRDLLRALDYAPKWRPYLEAIAHAIPTISDFQRLVRRGVYGGDERTEFQYDAEYPAAFTDKMALHGLGEQDAKDLWAGGWRMPSAGQLYHMLWRKEIDPKQLGKGLKALDYPVFWRDKLANIARPVPPRLAIERLHKAGLLTDGQARDLYGQLGYTLEHANLLLQLKGATTTAAGKDLTLSQLTSEYERGMIDAAEFRTEVESLGYDAAEADTFTALAERKRVDRAREQAISTIRTAYVGHRLREPEARAALAERDVPAAAVDAVFIEWTAARAANVKVLTAANLKALYKSATIGRDEALAELTFRGYSDADAERLVGTWE
jgi:hypothetical protein